MLKSKLHAHGQRFSLKSSIEDPIFAKPKEWMALTVSRGPSLENTQVLGNGPNIEIIHRC